MPAIDKLLEIMVKREASDLHLTTGQRPVVRIHGVITPLADEPVLTSDAVQAFLDPITHEDNRKQLAVEWDTDFAYKVEGLGRFRVNGFHDMCGVGAVFRLIPDKIPTFEQLGLPRALREFCYLSKGLVLVTGPTGSGKTTTLYAALQRIDAAKCNIITIEDPIEFLHKDEMASISQREVGIDTPSFAIALRAALRQDPDVILVGEIRDQETMDIALKAAETGHLVLTTLHTPDVTRTINRMIALFDLADPTELRDRIANSLQGIVAQRLLPKVDGEGLVLASEVLVMTGTARETIRRPENNPPLKEVMEKGVHPYGMQTFPMDLKRLMQLGVISKDVARAAAGF